VRAPDGRGGAYQRRGLRGPGCPARPPAAIHAPGLINGIPNGDQFER